jgi:hypothetical protein
MISVADVLKAISDKRSLALFRIVALTKPNTIILISKTKLTRNDMNLGFWKRINYA